MMAYFCIHDMGFSQDKDRANEIIWKVTAKYRMAGLGLLQWFLAVREEP
jgi:hypothetical protein